MSEADWGNPHWKEYFYGLNYERLSEINATYDSEGAFYCGTCVGSDEWEEEANGALCRVNA
jgi:hypothetical protein